MSPTLSLQHPYVIAPLPRPVDHVSGRYVVGEVHGIVRGTKRKRSEVAVGVDGEGINIYDISASKLVTAYALPPQSSFTCAPTSTRLRISRQKSERRTYVSIAGPQRQLILFRETNEGFTSSVSSTVSTSIEESSSLIVSLATVTSSSVTAVPEHKYDLITVRENGEVDCYDGDHLQHKWTSPASALARNAVAGGNDAKVECVLLTNAHSASQGLLKDRNDVFAVFPQEITADGFNPEILVIITASIPSKARLLHIVSFPRRSTYSVTPSKSSVETLLSVELPWHHSTSQASKPAFLIQPSRGTVQQLSDETLHTFDLTESIPKQVSRINSVGAQSFLRLDSTSTMVSTGDKICVYNSRYRSILATLDLERTSTGESLKRKRGQEETNGLFGQTFEFVAYFPKAASAIAISGSDLIAIQVETQQDRYGRPRRTGLLIDSIGCKVLDEDQHGRSNSSVLLGMHTLNEYLPGSIGIKEPPWTEQVATIDAAARNRDVDNFEGHIAPHFGVQWAKEVNGNGNGNGTSVSQNATTTTLFPASDVDRRWVIYALRKIFTITEHHGVSRLSIEFYPPNVFMWLLTSGNMTVANIEQAMKSFTYISQPGQLVDVLVDVDPEMDLLLALLAKTFLGAAELLHALRRLMESLGLFGEEATTRQAMLTNGDHELENGDPEEEVERLEAQAEDDLAIAEYQLGPGSGVRSQALSLSLSKLYRCPRESVVSALQTTFKVPETVSLMYLLRFELARGAWTSRYLDDDESEIIDEDAEISNNEIILIASLLNNCVDAIGAGGWISGDARMINGDPFEAEELIASLKLEVSAALEGIEEAEYLRGLVTEMVRYGGLVQKALPKGSSDATDVEDAARQNNKVSKPLVLPTGEQEKILPFGMKVEKQISLRRVVAGGEIQKRTMRDIGHLKSQKVGKYTLERIVV